MLCNMVTLRFNGAEHWCWSLTPNRRRAFVSTSLPASFQDRDTIDLGNRKGSGDRACPDVIASANLRVICAAIRPATSGWPSIRP